MVEAVTPELASAELSVVMPVASAVAETLVEAVDAEPVEDSVLVSASWASSRPQAARASATVTWWIAGERWRIVSQGKSREAAETAHRESWPAMTAFQ
ncbi:MAG: hypothetical protein IPH07_34515 [Deltaproteobacteria bacterium]|nr:hypothetical protein [Deltaproteobacteria bacterium]MBP7287892.1 hypothetical protein [Nannocystaceae bacterium]